MNSFKYLWGLFRAFPRKVAAFFLASQVNNVVGFLFTGYIARGFLNHLSGQADHGLDLGAALSLLALSLLLAVASQVATIYGSVTVERHSMALLSLNIMERLFRRPGGLSLPDDRRKGRPLSEGQCLNTLGNDTVSVPALYNFLFDSLGMLVSGIAAFIIMYSIDSFVTLVVLLPLAGVFLAVNLLQRRMEPLAEQSRRTSGEVSSMLADMFSNVQTIKTQAAEAHFIAEFGRLNERRLRAYVKSEVFFTLLKGLNSGLAEIGAGAILLAAAGSMRRGTFTIGDFVLFSSYQMAALGIFRWGGTLLGEIRRNNVSIGRMESLMSPEPPLAPVRMRKLGLAKVPGLELHVDGGSSEPLASLEVRQLSFRYPRRKASAGEDGGEGRPAEGGGQDGEAAGAGGLPFGLEGIDLCLEGGSLVVVTGPIGSGKTTLLKCVLGLLPAEAEGLTWNGREIPRSGELERATFWRAPRSAYTPQVPRLFSDSIEGNILLGIPRGEVDLDALVSQACLEPDLREMPEGLATPIGPRGVRLSGGQIQRVAAARMFARRASLNVLDDISSALDVETEKKLWDRLMEGRRDRTFLVVSHREALLRRADQILLMEGGRIVARGRFEELREGSELFRRLLREEEAVDAG
jgi:ATP-binding cassette subfamily B protein